MPEPVPMARIIKRVPPNAVRLPRVDATYAKSANLVLSCRYGLKMRGVDTGPVSAQVVDLKVARNLAYRKFIHNAVSEIRHPTSLELAVPGCQDASAPRPALIHTAAPYVVPDRRPCVSRMHDHPQKGFRARGEGGSQRPPKVGVPHDLLPPAQFAPQDDAAVAGHRRTLPMFDAPASRLRQNESGCSGGNARWTACRRSLSSAASCAKSRPLPQYPHAAA